MNDSEETFYGYLVYNSEEGQAEIMLEPSFLEENHVAQLDVLQDWIACLNNMYEVTLSESRTPKDE